MTVFQGNIVQPHRIIAGRGAVFGSVPLSERFWAKVKKTKSCWNWIGSVSRGRGQINIGGKIRFASRVSWTIHEGRIPRGKKVLHRCDNPLCVRPSHLFLGSHYENMMDMQRKGRKAILSFEDRSAVQRRPEIRQARSRTMSATRWITNSVKSRRIHRDDGLPRGWRYGRKKYKRK